MENFYELLKSVKPDLKIILEDQQTISIITTVAIPRSTNVPHNFISSLEELLIKFLNSLHVSKIDLEKEEGLDLDPKEEIESDFSDINERDLLEEDFYKDDRGLKANGILSVEGNIAKNEKGETNALDKVIGYEGTENKKRIKNQKRVTRDCSSCGKTFSRSDVLKHHFLKCSGKGYKPVICQVCGKSLRHQKGLQIHMSNKHSKKMLSCELCDFKAGSKRYLTAHTKTVHGEKKFMCDICDFSTSLKLTLNNHLKTHVAREFTTCTICGKSVLNIYAHMYRHNEETGNCDICGKEMNLIKLKDHKRKTHGEKKLSCEFCSYKSNSHSNFKAHVNTHLGIRNRGPKDKCQFCEVQTRNMDLHLKIFHPEKL